MMCNNSVFKLLHSIFIFLCLQSLSLTSVISSEAFQKNDTLLSGYQKDISGEVLNYHSCHPKAVTSLLIRCLNQQDIIEWETVTAMLQNDNDTVVFCWIGGFSTGTSKADHLFHLYINGDEKLMFKTVPMMPLKGWQVKGRDGYVLEFMFVSEDQVQDHFGYFFLKVPSKNIMKGKPLKIGVKGDASGSRDWYMTMRYSLVPRLNLQPEEAVLKGENGQPKQRLKISLDHYSRPEEAEILIDGTKVFKSILHFGVNDFIVPVIPVTKPEEFIVEVAGATHKAKSGIIITPVRPYKVFLLPHSHVDIGYTDVQPVIAQIHASNVKKAMKLISASANYPEGSRFKWNVEMLWEAEAFLQSATEDEKKSFFSMIRTGSIQLEGMYAGVMTGLCRDEELYHLFDYKFELEKENNLKIDNAMITDIPGYSWGLIPVMAQCGIKYFSIGPNTGDRIGNTIKAWGDKPFWWASPSGKEKVLCWMSSRGYSLFHAGSLAKSDGSQVLDYLAELSKTNYPYDLVQLRYTVGGDNGYPDTLLADYVKEWNQKYISPVLKIATTNEMFKEFETKYGTELNTYQGDFSPYWEDGAASTARETALNRRSAEKLIQASALYAMTRPGLYPEKLMYTAWNNVILFSEHTWGAWNSISDPDLANVKDQWEIKKGFAEAADLISSLILDKACDNKSEPNTISNEITVFNTNSWQRNGLILLPANKVVQHKSSLADKNGKVFPGQLLSSGQVCYYLRNIQPFNVETLHFVKDIVTANEIKVKSAGIENTYFLIHIDTVTGEIKSIYDKARKKEWCDSRTAYGMNSYWYTGRNAKNKARSGATTFKVLEKGPVIGTLKIVSQAPGCEKIIREISLVAGEEKIRIKDYVIKKAVREGENVRFVFPFDISSPQLRMDMAWFTLEPGKNQLPGSNVNFYTVQRWIDASNEKEGMTIVTPDAPLWETGDMTAESWEHKEGNTWMEKPVISSTLFSWVMNNSWHTNFKADQEGEALFEYVLCPHDRFDGKLAYQQGIEETQPLICMTGKQDILQADLPSFQPDNDVVVSSVTPVKSEPGTYIYRFFNLSNSQRIYKPFNSRVQMNLVSPEGKVQLNELSDLDFSPHDIQNVRVKVLK